MHLRHILRSAILAVATGAALVAAPVLADTVRNIVGNGETFAVPHAYTYYRFIVKGRSSNNGFRIAEFALYDKDGNRVNQGLTAALDGDKATTNLLAGTYALYRNQASDVYDSFDRMFDGNPSTSCNAWINTADTEWHWWYFVMRLADGANPVFSYNVALPTSETAKSPRSWALQASDDHESWITLDEYDAAAAADAALSSGGWCNGGENIPVDDESANFFIERGGTLTVTSPAEVKSVHTYGGTVSIASGAALGIDVPSGESARFTGGGLAGAGAFEKTGAGTLAVSGINSGFGGKIESSGGTLAFRPLHASPKFTYYRFIIKDRDAVYGGSDQLKMTEIALFGADGRHINGDLVEAAAEDKATTNLLAGTFAVYRNQASSWGNDSYKNLFDGKTSTGCHVWISTYNSEWHWAYFVFRPMAENDVAPASYNVGFASDCNVRSWALQGSDDHTTWFTLDEKDATSVAEIKPNVAGWGNSGTPLPLTWEGYNAPVGEVDAKFFRFTVKAVGASSGGVRAISELALYDLQGKRLNIGLLNGGNNVSPSSLSPNSFTWKYEWGTPHYDPADQTEANMFDENMETRLQGYSFGNQPDPSKSSTWLVWTMRLTAATAPVASYNFAPYGTPGGQSCPANWLVEASKDGTTWFEVDARSGEGAAALLPTTAKTYCNGGHPIGFTTGLDRWLCPTGAVVEVANGATLELPASAPNTVSGLAADLTAASPLGTIANFNPAAAGTLYLTTATAHPMLENYALPITFTGLANAANVENWNVVVNGVAAEADEYALGFDENDVLRVTRRRGPTVIYMR